MDASTRTSPNQGQPAAGTPDPARTARGAVRWLPTSTLWWGGLGFLRFHASLFLAGVPILFLVNLVQSPEHIWIDRAGLAWFALLVIHAAIVGIARSIGLLREDTQQAAPRESTAQPRSTWITSRSEEPQDADFRVPAREPDATGWGVPVDATEASWRPATPLPVAPVSLAQPAPPSGTSVWDGWTSPGRSGRRATTTTPSASRSTAKSTAPSETSSPDAPAAGEERVSWREVTKAAWLAPSEEEVPPADSASTKPPS
ncbi:MAG: hypothetical protein QM589_16415 [Thermomicrobiales bacterium]